MQLEVSHVTGDPELYSPAMMEQKTLIHRSQRVIKVSLPHRRTTLRRIAATPDLVWMQLKA